MIHNTLSDDSYVQHPDIVVRSSADGAVVYSPLAGSYYAINDVAKSILEIIQAPATISIITDALCAEYEAPRDVILRDVHGALEYLRTARLVEVVAPSRRV